MTNASRLGRLSPVGILLLGMLAYPPLGLRAQKDKSDLVALGARLTSEIYLSPLAIENALVSVKTEEFVPGIEPERIWVSVSLKETNCGAAGRTVLEVYYRFEDGKVAALHAAGTLITSSRVGDDDRRLSRKRMAVEGLLRGTGWHRLVSEKDILANGRRVIAVVFESGDEPFDTVTAIFDQASGLPVSVGVP